MASFSGDMLVQVNLYFTRSVFLCKMLPFLNMDLKTIVIYVDEAQLYRLRPFEISAKYIIQGCHWVSMWH